VRYDPYIEEISNRPSSHYDLAINTDVLEHIPEADLDRFIEDIKSLSDRAVFVISTTFADQLLDNGENAHCTIREPKWWRDKLLKHYPLLTEVPTAVESACGFTTWVPQPATLLRLRRLKRLEKLGAKLNRLRHAPADLFRYMRGRFTTESELLEALKDRRVALIGNSPALGQTESGAEIDRHDIVIRLNRAPIIAIRSHGLKTDWVATGVPIKRSFVTSRNIRYVLWMAKVRRMPRWMLKHRFVFIYPSAKMAELERTVGKRPSTGYMMIDMLARSKCRSATLYGFDFFENLSVSGHRTAAEVPHDFAKERELVDSLMKADKRFSLRR
jgi:hypothetical protein